VPALTGRPAPGSGDRMGDAAIPLNLVNKSGQAYLRDEIDPLPLDYRLPASARGPAPPGWKQFELVVNRALTVPSTGEKLPAEIINVGAMRYGDAADDSRSLWTRDGDDLVIRVPWAMLGFADPSAHRVQVPKPSATGVATPATQIGPGAALTVSANGTDLFTGDVTWVNWNRPYYTERLKNGAGLFRDAAFEVTR
jgi:hypothetical protein